MSNVTRTQLAARSVRFLLPETRYPDVFRRIEEFMADRGAVGYVLHDVESGASLEEACTRYWQTRQGGNSRLEDLVTGLVLSFLLGLVTNAVYDFLKANTLPMAFARQPSESEPTRMSHEDIECRKGRAGTLMALYRLKLEWRDRGAEQWSTFESELETHIRRGGTIREFLLNSGNGKSLSEADRDLAHASEVIAGVMSAEAARHEAPKSVKPSLTSQVDQTSFPVKSLSSGFAVGELVSWLADPLGREAEADWIVQQLDRPFIYPEAWEDVGTFRFPARKIVALQQGTEEFLARKYRRIIDQRIAGFIGFNQGQTSHLAIQCRGLGLPAITMDRRQFVGVGSYPIAAFADESLLLCKKLNTELARYLRTI